MIGQIHRQMLERNEQRQGHLLVSCNTKPIPSFDIPLQRAGLQMSQILEQRGLATTRIANHRKKRMSMDGFHHILLRNVCSAAERRACFSLVARVGPQIATCNVSTQRDEYTIEANAEGITATGNAKQIRPLRVMLQPSQVGRSLSGKVRLLRP